MAYFGKLLSLARLQARLPLVNKDGTGTTAFVDTMNRVFANIEGSINDQGELLNQIADILKITKKTQEDVDAIKAANDAAAREAALNNSYTDPTQVLSSIRDTTTTPVTIKVAILNHKRIYADPAKTTVDVLGKVFTGLDLNTVYYFYYDDPARLGGDVNIMYSKNNLDAAQTGVRHSLGSIVTPAADGSEASNGGGVSPPGGRYNERFPDGNYQEP